MGNMKKGIAIGLLVVLLASLVAVPALAKPGKATIKGQVVAVGFSGSLTIQTQRGEMVEVILPDGFNIESLVEGDWVLVKGFWSDGMLEAEWIKKIGPFQREEDLETTGAGKMNGAYCSEGKQVKPHPLAVRLEDMFGVTQEWVMGYFCNGQGMGAIMLALKMRDAHEADAEVLLAERAGGKGWARSGKRRDGSEAKRKPTAHPAYSRNPNRLDRKKISNWAKWTQGSRLKTSPACASHPGIS
jgi:hypothetical protein